MEVQEVDEEEQEDGVEDQKEVEVDDQRRRGERMEK